MDETTLTRRAQDGDKEALDVLVRHYRQRIYRTAYRLLVHEDDALDVCQEVIVRFAQGLGTLRDAALLWPWLRTITVNACYSHFRHLERERRGRSQLAQSLTDVADPRPSPAAQAQRREQLGRIERAVADLPPQRRTVLVLRFYEELTLAEIAEQLDLTVGAVKAHLFQATQQLRERLNSTGTKTKRSRPRPTSGEKNNEL